MCAGDNKEYKGETLYFCDCPLHRNCLKWHVRIPETCRTRIHCMKKTGTDTDNKDIIEANIGEENDAFDDAVKTDSSPPQGNAPSDI